MKASQTFTLSLYTKAPHTSIHRNTSFINVWTACALRFVRHTGGLTVGNWRLPLIDVENVRAFPSGIRDLFDRARA